MFVDFLNKCPEIDIQELSLIFENSWGECESMSARECKCRQGANYEQGKVAEVVTVAAMICRERCEARNFIGFGCHAVKRRRFIFAPLRRRFRPLFQNFRILAIRLTVIRFCIIHYCLHNLGKVSH